jgi:hypothetical protein
VRKFVVWVTVITVFNVAIISVSAYSYRISQDCELCHLILAHDQPVDELSLDAMRAGDAILQILRRAEEHGDHGLAD